MSKPEDISPELIDAADKIMSDAWKAHDADFNPASNSISDGLWGKFVNSLAAAILAAKAEEREAILQFEFDLPCTGYAADAFIAVREYIRKRGN